MKDFILYITLRAVLFILRLLPLRLWLFFASCAGWLYYYFAGKKNRRAYAHLRLAFPERAAGEWKRIIHKMYMRFAQNYFETLYLPFLDEGYIRAHVKAPHFEAVKDALSGKCGGIFLASHAGSWELSNIACAVFLPSEGTNVVRYGMLVQPQKRYRRLDAFLNKTRESRNAHVFKVDELKKVVTHLSGRNVLGVVADHGGKDGIPVEFFGKLAMTPVGGVKLARKLGCKIFVAFMRRTGGPYHEMLFKPYELVSTGDEDEDLRINLTHINRIFEEWISQYPEEYLWFYKRWKYTPVKNILILSDGKPGHLKQSQALSAMVSDLGRIVKRTVVEVRTKKGAWNIFLSLAGFFLGSRSLRTLLPFCVTSKTYQDVMKGSYDMVVSAGASLGPVNLAVALENNCQSVCVMKPGILPLERFDLALIPEHDKPPCRKNVLATLGSLNSVTPESIKEDFHELLSARRGLQGMESVHNLKIGLLVGGDSKNYRLLAEMVQFLCLQLEKILQEKDAALFVTTSRRTSPEVVTILKKAFQDNPRCPLFVNAAEDNPAGTVGGIFYLSDIIVVSGESISMVSEAAASGKHVVVFEPKRLTEDNKVRRFLSDLAQKKYIYLVKLNELYDKVLWLLTAKPETKALDTRERVMEGLKKILSL